MNVPSVQICEAGVYLGGAISLTDPWKCGAQEEKSGGNKKAQHNQNEMLDIEFERDCSWDELMERTLCACQYHQHSAFWT